jgi:hypothetical protein
VFHHACQVGTHHLLAALMGAGQGSIDAVINMRTPAGAAPIHLALDCDAGNVNDGLFRREKLRVLLSASDLIDVDAVYNGRTPLQLARELGDEDPTLELLVQARVRDARDPRFLSWQQLE